MSGYKLRATAEADLVDIWRYTATTWSSVQAERYHGSLIAAFETLAQNPLLGRDVSAIRTGYRSHSVGEHVVFYTLHVDFIDIARILHRSRDFPRHV